MGIIYILTVVIQVNQGPSGAIGAITSYNIHYDTKGACESAREVTRQSLSSGRLLLLTCTPKG